MNKEIVINCYNKGYRVLLCGLFVNHVGKIINGTMTKSGYFKISFRFNGSTYYVKAHRLQAYQKYGNDIFSEGVEVRHKNGIKTDNSFKNIILGTHKENMNDVPSDIRNRRSEIATSFVRKYNKEEVKKYRLTHGYKETMDHFGITSKGTMSYIMNS